MPDGAVGMQHKPTNCPPGSSVISQHLQYLCVCPADPTPPPLPPLSPGNDIVYVVEVKLIGQGASAIASLAHMGSSLSIWVDACLAPDSQSRS